MLSLSITEIQNTTKELHSLQTWRVQKIKLIIIPALWSSLIIIGPTLVTVSMTTPSEIYNDLVLVIYIPSSSGGKKWFRSLRVACHIKWENRQRGIPKNSLKPHLNYPRPQYDLEEWTHRSQLKCFAKILQFASHMRLDFRHTILHRQYEHITLWSASIANLYNKTHSQLLEQLYKTCSATS